MSATLRQEIGWLRRRVLTLTRHLQETQARLRTERYRSHQLAQALQQARLEVRVLEELVPAAQRDAAAQVARLERELADHKANCAAAHIRRRRRPPWQTRARATLNEPAWIREAIRPGGLIG